MYSELSVVKSKDLGVFINSKYCKLVIYDYRVPFTKMLPGSSPLIKSPYFSRWYF